MLAANAVFAAVCAARSLEIMPVGEVKPGMKGVGYSVFKGTKPEPFNAEIIAVIPRWETGNDLILARLTGAGLETSGVIAGMSGSPVYIEGKLIGAVAYGWSWPKEAIAGIQPIEYMLKLWAEPSVGPKKESGGSAPPSAQKDAFKHLRLRGAKDAEMVFSDVPGAGYLSIRATADSLGEIELKPIMTPLMVSNMDSESVGFLKKNLARYNILPVQGGGAGGGLESMPGEDDLCAGCVIGSPLMTGDFQAAAIGTVTVREGDRLLAFGHPFMNGGASAIPLAGGRIFHILTSLEGAEKMGASGRQLGAIVDDRLSAIAGRIGEKADYFPMDIEITDADSSRVRRFSVQIAQVKYFVQYMTYVAILTSIYQSLGMPREGVTIKAVVDGELEDYPRAFHFEDMFLRPYNSTYDFLGYIFDLLENPFREVRIKSIRVKLSFIREWRYYDLMDVSLGAASFRPGDTVRAFLKLKSHNDKETQRTVEFRIPDNVKEGQFNIEFEGGGGMFGIPTPVAPENYDQYFDILSKWIPQNAVSVKFVYPDKALGVGGVELQNLPASVGNTLMQGPAPQRSMFGGYDRSVLLADSVIYGKVVLQIKVDKEFQP